MADKPQATLPPFAAKPRPIKLEAIVRARKDGAVKQAGPKPRFAKADTSEEAAC